ncbi:MAG: DUF4276 family protein [Proteobacteria bacterium]|nr:DUF4276 family protein [Pseudomonadota bacterium]MBU1387215.1 DUF4276 family protein [Pseudomonadota bacterium]MBU1543659.1 DUF4276 family protein [Pseudomonadota bacterium]MBU2479860.1 DUF4276 family protein [Pseudomonadota bacterium]
MIRLNIVVEGQTEETFINKILGPHLAVFNVFARARCVETGRKRNQIFRGGMISYHKAQKDIQLWMKEDKGDDARFTTMFDFYKLPGDFPGFNKAKQQPDPYRKIEVIEDKLSADIASPRFIPYLQLHEYEALLFSDIEKFHHYYIDHNSQLTKLKQDVSGVTNPELINENPDTAPSKRIIKFLPSYDREKPSAGPIIAEHIGLQKIRSKCQHFNAWVSQLETLNNY